MMPPHDTNPIRHAADKQNGPNPAVNFFRIEHLSLVLRGLGSLIIIAAAAIFLLQHWQEGNDIHRYLMLLGFTAVLSVAGFFCGLRLREGKGARTLLGLTLAVIPVHFAVLGGLLYSQFALDAATMALPSYAQWIAPGPAAALLTTGGALLLLAPLAYLSFLTLGRVRAGALTAVFLAGNALLLLPVRSPNVTGLVIAALAVAVLWSERAVFSRETGLKTLEGRVLRGLTALPIVLLIGRSLRFYELSELLVAAIFGSVAIFTFTLAPKLTNVQRTKSAIEAAGAIPAAISWLLIASTLLSHLSLPAPWIIPVCALPFAGILLAMSTLCSGTGTGFRRAAGITVVGAMIVNLLAFPGLGTSLACLLAGAATVAYGVYVEQKLIFLSGLVATLGGLLYHLKFAVTLYSIGCWWGLALLGIGIVIGASLLEKYYGQLLHRGGKLRERMKTWAY